MNKTAIKGFAVWARNKLIEDIKYQAGLMGISEKGVKNPLPQSVGAMEFYDIGTVEPHRISGDEIKQRRRLVEVIKQKAEDIEYQAAYQYVMEEVAYTWFNRLIAIRFMEVNDYLPSHIRVLSSESDGKLEPDLVTNPFDGDLDFTTEEEQIIMKLKQENQLDELFHMLFIKQCNALNKILPGLFEKTKDYTELLLNLSVIDQDGVVYHLVHDISEADFDVQQGGQVEIIGWLYQYYNTEPKDETFALLKKNVKITKERIPAATQLFTPDWIVRYMVENSLGRLWLEGHPNDELKREWKYYLDEAEQEADVQIQLEEIRKEYQKLNPEDIKVIDPCMGSGHILVYAFDVLMQIYESVGYGRREAARSILENNLYGLDIDDRAYQMAYFAVMMKARQYNRRILDGEVVCHVHSIQESNGVNREQLKYFGAGMSDIENNIAIMQIKEFLNSFKDAKEYGCVLNIEDYDWGLLYRFCNEVREREQITFNTMGIKDTQNILYHLLEIGQIMAQKYHIVVTNPPYMSLSRMGSTLSKFVKINYEDSKTDMFAIFIEKCEHMVMHNGFQAMITQHAWMFLANYEKLRDHLNNLNMINMIHLGAHAFDEIGGEVVQTCSFTMRKKCIANYKGIYCRLIMPNTQQEKANMFLRKENLYLANQEDFSNIPGNLIAYWVSQKMRNNFHNFPALNELADIKNGLGTMDNERFLRYWSEVNWENICFDGSDCLTFFNSGKKWAPYNKGGAARKWYGNRELVVNWHNNGAEIKALAKGATGGRIVSVDFYFKESISWSYISQGRFAVRYFPKGVIFDSVGTSCFPKQNVINNFYLLGLLNSIVIKEYLHLLAPTLAFNPGSVGKLPVNFMDKESYEKVIDLVQENIFISKTDWDNFEISWDFQYHPLIRQKRNISSYRLGDIFLDWEVETKNRIESIMNNETVLNQIFTKAYGLISEIDIKVDKKEILIRSANVNRDIKSLLSYFIGCIFGRYSLDTPGLVYAGGTWSNSKYSSFFPNLNNIIPITDKEYLEDDIISRLCEWLKVVYGAETLEENLDFIAKALNNKGDTSREIIRNYFLNDFFKDHCRTYSVTGSGKRPIYWLFDSGKQNGFKALIYLHRYTPDTIGNLRIDYLHRLQRIYESEISRMQDMIDHSTNARETAKATKRKEKLQKQLKECREYDEKISHLALSRIELDLDDGVKVNYEKIQTASDGKKYQVLAKI